LFLCFVFLLDYLFFPFPLTYLLSITSHPSILNITRAIITSQKIIAHSTGTITTSRAMTGTEKTGKPVSQQQKISTGTRGK
jgi:hypothetical protein